MENVWLTETYFTWLKSECFSIHTEQREYEGVLRTLHDIPFYWTIWSDENRAGDAMSFRQHDFLGFQRDLDSMDQVWLGNWAMATPSVLEVLLGMARRYSAYYEGQVPFYFGHFFLNMQLDRFPGRILNGQGQEAIRLKMDNWMSHQILPNGVGSPTPLANAPEGCDMRTLDIWGQMNAYSVEHFQ